MALRRQSKPNKDFTKGSIWTLVKDLKGFPSHNQGGIDIFVDENSNVGFTKENSKIHAKCGCIIPANSKAKKDVVVKSNNVKRYIKRK